MLKFGKNLNRYSDTVNSPNTRFLRSNHKVILKLVFFAYMSGTSWGTKKLFTSICILVWRAFRWHKNFSNVLSVLAGFELRISAQLFKLQSPFWILSHPKNWKYKSSSIYAGWRKQRSSLLTNSNSSFSAKLRPKAATKIFHDSPKTQLCPMGIKS